MRDAIFDEDRSLIRTGTCAQVIAALRNVATSPEGHGGHIPPAGVLIRVLQRILALTAALWHNDHIGQPIKRSLLADDR